jgi:hypothetical protein
VTRQIDPECGAVFGCPGGVAGGLPDATADIEHPVAAADVRL